MRNNMTNQACGGGSKMVLRSRPVMQENGSSHDLNPCVMQYCEVPYAYNSLERHRDLKAISQGGVRFPAKQCFLTVFSCFFIAVIVMPFLAITKLPSERQDIAWWKRGIIYHINVASFYDSDGDGIGDLNGISQKLDYIQSLGVLAVELSPFYHGCFVSEGSSVTNHTAVDPVYGSLADLEDLITQLHQRGMKLVIPFIPNHTSDEHPWFLASSAGTVPYTNFYVWNKGKQGNPPNNWLSTDGGSAWTLHTQRREYYYHKNSAHMPDLNYHNPEVVQAINEVMSFWLRQGVDGFRIHGVEGLVESNQTTLNEPLINDQNQSLTLHQPESLRLMDGFNRLIKKSTKKRWEIPLIPCVSTQFSLPEFWLSTYDHGGDMPQNQALTRLTPLILSGHTLHSAVNNVMDNIPFNKGEHWITWNSEDVGVSRIWSELRSGELAEVGLALTLLLPGTGIVYYGQEIGMTNLDSRDTEAVRNCVLGQSAYEKTMCNAGRGLMQWNGEEHGGFSASKKAWLPVHQSYTKRNIQTAELEPSSLLHAFRSMISLRENVAFMLGQHNPMVVNDNIYSFCRINRGRIFPKYFVTMNVGTESSTDNYQDTKVTLKIPEDFMEATIKVPASGQIVYHSANFAETSQVGKVINIQSLTLRPGQVLVVKL